MNMPNIRWKLWFFLLVSLPIAGVALYTWGTLNWSYSNGERTGYIQKFSKKGWVCKTWEGELTMLTAPGTVPEKFIFTVRDDAVAAQLNSIMGKRVVLSYEQHKGVPTSCFGETEYFVISVKAAD